jgi:hypothetical protein
MSYELHGISSRRPLWLVRLGEALGHVLYVLDMVTGFSAALQSSGCGAREPQEHARRRRWHSGHEASDLSRAGS